MDYIRTPQQAERNAAEQMRALGFADAQVTRGGADGGIDVRSSRAIAQVKYQAHQIGRPAVQNLYGARGTDHHLKMLFFAGTAYSAPAIKYADSVGVCLFEYSPLGELTAINAAAVALRREAVKTPGVQRPPANNIWKRAVRAQSAGPRPWQLEQEPLNAAELQRPVTPPRPAVHRPTPDGSTPGKDTAAAERRAPRPQSTRRTSQPARPEPAPRPTVFDRLEAKDQAAAAAFAQRRGIQQGSREVPAVQERKPSWIARLLKRS